MALIGTLTDNFNDNSIDATKWNDNNGAGSQLLETNQQIEITGDGSGTYYLGSSTEYDLTASSQTVKIISVATDIAYVYLYKDAGDDRMGWRINDGGNIIAFYYTGGTGDVNKATATYVAATHRYLRIRESGGTIYWEYSATGYGTWTSFASESVATLFVTVRPYLIVSATSTVFKFDNFNLLPTQTDRTKTKLLCHFDGADAATSYTSDDANARVATFAGSAQLDTAIKEQGTASLLLASATSDYLTFPHSADWVFGTGDLTIDFWVYFVSLPGNGDWMGIVEQDNASSTRFVLDLYNSAGTYQWDFDINGVYDYYVNSSGLSTGKFYHIALVRTGSSWYFFQDGVQQGSTGSNAASIPDYSSVLYIGCDIPVGSRGKYLDGQIDELRIIVGEATWTANFTPPVEYYMQSSENIRFFFGVSP